MTNAPEEKTDLETEPINGDDVDHYIGESVEPEHDLDQNALKGLTDGLN